MRHATVDEARLIDLARTQLELRADAKRVVLAATRAESLELHIHGEATVAELVAQQSRRATIWITSLTAPERT